MRWDASLLGVFLGGAILAHRPAARWASPKRPLDFEGFLAACAAALIWPLWAPLWLVFRATYGRRREEERWTHLR